MTNYPVYHSPIRLLEELGLKASDISSETLRSSQSKLLQVLHGSDKDSFQIGSKSLTRNEFIEFTKALDSLDSLRIHQLILEQPVLLNLLENCAISGNKQEDYRMRSDLGEDRQKFGDFISPYLAHSIDQLLVKTIRKSNYTELNKISPLFKILKEADGVYAFRNLKEWGDTLDTRLNNPSIVRVEYPADRYIHFCYSPFYDLINTASKFYPSLPDTIGNALTVFTLSYKKSKNREDNLLKISNQLQRLKCSPNSRQLILNNHAQFRSETKDSGKGNSVGLWVTVISAAVIIPIIIIFVYSQKSNDSESKSYIPSQRKTYVSTTPSPSRVLESGFDMDAFKLLHDHTYACVVQRDFAHNSFVWDGVPDIKSPLEVTDSATMQPKGKKVFLSNKTNSEMLMVVRDENALTTHYVRANSKIRLNLDPNSMIFFYAGNDWTEDENIVYDHPYQNIMTNSWTIRYTGCFKLTNAIDQRFLKKMHLLKNGSVSDLQILKEDGEYIFKGKRFNIPTI